jgi:transcriptional regulator with XRE-family HTH domain
VRSRKTSLSRKLSQAELARRSGVPQSTISRIEAGETGSISLANLVHLAEALDINAALLILHEPKKRGER